MFALADGEEARGGWCPEIFGAVDVDDFLITLFAVWSEGGEDKGVGFGSLMGGDGDRLPGLGVA